MDKDEYQIANVQAALIGNALEQLPLAAMREAQEHAHAVGPIVDPTLYRATLDDLRIDAERTQILLEAQRKLRALRARVEGRASA